MGINASRGDMYPFVDFTHCPVKGGCHDILHGYGCRYCFMKFGERAKSRYYQGPLELYREELQVVYKPGKVYFIGSAVDMWHPNVDDYTLGEVLSNCSLHYRMTPNALDKPVFMFQSKGPDRFQKFLGEMPPNTWLATTVETDDLDRYGGMSRAPLPTERIAMMKAIQDSLDYYRMKFILSIEPVMKWTNLDNFLAAILQVKWDIISIGADTWDVIAREDQPSAFEISMLARELENAGATICVKKNCANLVQTTDPAQQIEVWEKAGWIIRREDRRKASQQLTLGL